MGSTADREGRPRVIKTGPNAGQPMTSYYFALAIKKEAEKHWAETSWGQKIWAIGHASFPNGQAQKPDFAWKIIDGDSGIPNAEDKKWCDYEGFPGHWVLKFNSGFPVQVVNEDGSSYILEKDFVNLGDYVQVSGTISGNESTQSPGVYLNPSHVAFTRYGKRIVTGIDPKSIGFGKNITIPAEASLTPLSNSTPPPVAATYTPPPVTAVSVPPPHPGILNVGVTQAPVGRVMLPAAGGQRI